MKATTQLCCQVGAQVLRCNPVFEPSIVRTRNPPNSVYIYIYGYSVQLFRVPGLEVKASTVHPESLGSAVILNGSLKGFGAHTRTSQARQMVRSLTSETNLRDTVRV